MGGRFQGNYTNPCLTMHQPWASLLVYGIKRIEGRSWPAPLRGRLWIHAAGKVPDPATIKAMEDFYREIYAVNGVTDLKFPEHYPVSRLLGCVDVVGCVRCEELVCWEEVPEGVRLEGQTDFCWLCEKPQKLVIPFEMRGNQGVYNLERRIYEAAVRGLCQVEGPLAVKFPLPDPRDPFSLKPGSLVPYFDRSKAAEVEKPASLKAAIDGARAAATQFSKEQKHQTSSSAEQHASSSFKAREPRNKAAEVEKPASHKTVIDGAHTAATQFSQEQKHQTSSPAEQHASSSFKAREPRNKAAEVEKPASHKTVIDGAHTAATRFSQEQKRQTSSSAEQHASSSFKAREPRNKAAEVEKPASHKTVIDGAHTAATQFSQEQKHQTSSSAEQHASSSFKAREPRNKAAEVEKPASHKTVIDGAHTAATRFSQEQKHQTSSSAEQQRDASNSLKASEPRNREAEVEKPASLKTVIDSAHTAPTQFSEEQKHQTRSSTEQQKDVSISFKANEPRNKPTQDYRRSTVPVGYRDHMVISEENSSNNIQAPRRYTNHSAGGSKMFAAAMRGVRPT